MAKIIYQQSWINPIKMINTGYSMPSIYHTPDFDREIFRKQFRDWETSSRYSMKIQNDDKTDWQICSNIPLDIVLTLIDCNGRVFKTYASNLSTGNNVTIDGIDYPTNCLTYHLEFSGLAAGTYYLQHSLTYDDGTGEKTEIYISEPLLIQPNHPNTILIKCADSRNKYNAIFNANVVSFPTNIFTSFAFSVRVEGSVDTLDLKADDTQYNDQNFDMVMLNSYPYRVWALNIGGAVGVPDYLMDIIHVMLGCSMVQIDGKYYAKDDGANWQLTRADKRIFASLPVRESQNYGNKTIAYDTPAIVIDDVSQIPFAVHTLTLGAITDKIAFPVYNTAGLNSLMTWLNSTFVQNHSLKGSFLKYGNTVVYVNGTGETYTTGSSILLHKVFTANRFIDPIFPALGWTLKAKSIVVDYGDTYAANLATQSFGDNVIMATYTPSHAYSAMQSGCTISIFHENNMEDITINDGGFYSLTPTLPTSLINFSITGANPFFTAADFSTLLNPVGFTLKTLKITTGNLQNFWGFKDKTMSVLQTMDLRGNKFSVTVINNLLNDTRFMASMNTNLQSGTHSLNLSGQTPAAPPSNTGIGSAIYTLRNVYGWTVTTD